MKWAPLLLLGVLFVAAMTINVADTPPLWWDEGWTLSVARNWVERGHYGRLALGRNAPPGFEAAFPTTASVALAFKYFGVGVTQARLLIGLYSIGALALLFYLGARFFNRRVAVAALLVLLLMSGNRYIHPLFMARQVLAEAPSLFFLLGGFICLLWAGERKRSFVLGAILFWSVAIITKAQVLPFWIISVSVPLAITVYLRQTSAALIFAAALLGSLFFGLFLQDLIAKLLLTTSSPVSGLTEAVGFVTDPFRRFITLLTILQIGLPTSLGLLWALTQLKTEKTWKTYEGVVKIAFLSLAASWFAWWAVASPGWPRYLFPAAFLASIFVSAMLDAWTHGFRLRLALSHSSTTSRLRVAAAVFLIGWSGVQTTSDLASALMGRTNQALLRTANYLNQETPVTAIIETYESEIFFFLQRRYHYPPDQTTVELIRREDLGQFRPIDYDPLAADPDYLVVGGWCRYYKCYDHVLTRDNFKLVKAFGAYEIFQRVR